MQVARRLLTVIIWIAAIVALYDGVDNPITTVLIKLAKELSENEQYFGGSQLGGLGILTFIAMQEDRRNDAKRLANKILEIDSNMTFDKLRRHMKTFIIMDKAFMKKIKESLVESGIPA